jgi:hypothetical protein
MSVVPPKAEVKSGQWRVPIQPRHSSLAYPTRRMSQRKCRSDGRRHRHGSVTSSGPSMLAATAGRRGPGCHPFGAAATPAAWLGRQAPTGLVPSGRATADLILHEVEPPLSWRPEGQANASDETSIPDIINEHDTRSLGPRCSYDPAYETFM